MRMRRTLVLAYGLMFGMLAASPRAHPSALPRNVTDHYFLTTDGVRLHYLEAGPADGRTLVFVPGWTMPAWIWMPQIQAFSRHEPLRRGRDVAELIARLGGGPVVVVGWSLGVLDTLAAIHVAGDGRLAGLVLVDNSVGEEPPPPYNPVSPRVGPPPSHPAAMKAFVQRMFHRPQPPAFLDRLTQASLHTPEAASRLLLAYPVPRSYWKEAIYSTKVPVLYIIRQRWVAQAENLVRNRPHTEMEVFTDAGHALFVDEPVRFNGVIETFLRRHVWP